MTPETWTIIGTGIALAAVMLITTSRLGARIDRVEDKLGTRLDSLSARLESLSTRLDSLSERVARIEGQMTLLLQGLQIRIEPPPRA